MPPFVANDEEYPTFTGNIPNYNNISARNPGLAAAPVLQHTAKSKKTLIMQKLRMKKSNATNQTKSNATNPTPPPPVTTDGSGDPSQNMQQSATRKTM